MEPRKLISFGTSSYVISITKTWINKNELAKGDFIYLHENGNGEIVITPSQKEIKKEPRTISMNVMNKSLRDLRRELIANYIAGYDAIRLQGQINTKHYSDLRDIVRYFTTFDIVDQGKSYIVLKDFLNIEKISIEDLTRRIDLIIRSMIEDTKHINNNIKLDKVYAMDAEVNRITFMTFRFIKKALNDLKLAKLFGLSPDGLLSLWLLVSRLEKIADEVKRIAKFFKVLRLSKSETEEIVYVFTLIEKEYLNTVKAYYNKDRELAFTIAINKDRIIETCNKLTKKSSNAVCGSIVEKLKTMEIYIVYLARDVYGA